MNLGGSMAKDKSKELGDGERWLKNPIDRSAVVSDQSLIRWECYNPHDCTLYFDLMRDRIAYLHTAGISVGQARVICKARDWVVLNHAYYTCRSSDGREFITIVRNFGSAIGKGLTAPSKPE